MESGYYEHLKRAPEAVAPARGATHLITQITSTSTASTAAGASMPNSPLGRGAIVGHNQVQMLMRRGPVRHDHQFGSWSSIWFLGLHRTWSRMQVEPLDRKKWNTCLELANAIFV